MIHGKAHFREKFEINFFFQHHNTFSTFYFEKELPGTLFSIGLFHKQPYFLPSKSGKDNFQLKCYLY